MTEHPAQVPPFSAAGVTFRCWVIPAGPNEIGVHGTRLVWRAEGRDAVVGRGTGTDLCWAKANGRVIGQAYPSLKLAMKAAALAAPVARAA